jgi:hypothetical protein
MQIHRKYHSTVHPGHKIHLPFHPGHKPQHHQQHHPQHHQQQHHEPDTIGASGFGGYGASPAQMQLIQNFTKQQSYTQGYRFAFGAGITSQPLQLASPGKFLIGCSIIPEASSNISDTQVTLTINNNNVIMGVSAPLLNPGFIQGFLYYPTPQPLLGNDNIQVSFNKQNSGSIVLYFQMVYNPQIGTVQHQQ